MADLSAASLTVVIGCGNPARSDDGAGVEAIRRLIESDIASGRENVRLVDAGTSGMEVMFQARGAARVILIDACRSGSEPGAVFRVPGSELQAPAQPAFTMHGLRWDHALYAASQMFGADFARNIEVFLIEAETLEFGLTLSDAAGRGVARVVTEIEALLRASPPDDRDTTGEDATGEDRIWLANGRLHFTRAAWEQRFASCNAVALLARDSEWLLLPLQAGAGGLTVKLRNPAGDRVVESQEFFRSQGLEDSPEQQGVLLSPEAAGLGWRIRINPSNPR